MSPQGQRAKADWMEREMTHMQMQGCVLWLAGWRAGADGCVDIELVVGGEKCWMTRTKQSLSVCHIYSPTAAQCRESQQMKEREQEEEEAKTESLSSSVHSSIKLPFFHFLSQNANQSQRLCQLYNRLAACVFVYDAGRVSARLHEVVEINILIKN